MAPIEVLNPPDDVVLHRVGLHKAIHLIRREVVETVQVAPGQFFGPYAVPRVLRLRHPVVVPEPSRLARSFSKAGVLARDHHTCAYCGRSATTVDHVVPRADGGATGWLNLVACCQRCNQRKGDRSLRQVGMVLQWFPYVPAGVV